MYGIFTDIYHKNQPNVGKYTIHGSYGEAKKVTKTLVFLHPLYLLKASLEVIFPNLQVWRQLLPEKKKISRVSFSKQDYPP